MRALPLVLMLAAAPAVAGTLAYDEARNAVLAANPQARSAAAAMEAARLGVTSARAGLYPSLSAAASYSRSGTQGFEPGDSYSYGFNGSQPLFSPSVPASVRSAAAAYRAAEAAYDNVASRLSYELKTAFADILNARQVLVLSDGTLKRRAENLELIRLKYEAGRENKAALLETEAALKTAKWQHGRYRKDLLLLERKLNRLMGVSPAKPVPELRLPPAGDPPEDFSSFSDRLRSHYTVRAAKAAADRAAAGVASASAARLPEASANGSYRWSGSEWPDRTSSWSLGASLSLPIFSAGRLSSSLAAAKKSLASAEASLEDAGAEVRLNAEDAFLSWREAADYLDVAKSSLDAAEARAFLVRTQYLAGQSSYFEWRNVEEQYIGAQNQYLAAGRGLAAAAAAFDRALGD